ncbi:hypothetical protein VP01_2204g2 [Puccinia sorghi]|uniref:Uncharacterized protein n=1 Tax=Puccinia sorghi TaxID=27349 RepID=A0A0L6VAR9_9BASI|nr:hypothetical protein VP01_2204g2 [Puccinia sorghi]
MHELCRAPSRSATGTRGTQRIKRGCLLGGAISWEQERYLRKEAGAKLKEEKEHNFRKEKKDMVLDLLRQGKTLAKAEAVMRLIFE